MTRTEATARISVAIEKYRDGRKTRYLATFGKLEARGNTPAEAMRNLAKMLEEATQYADTRLYIKTAGPLLHVYHAGSGWAYDIIYPDRICSAYFGHGTTYEQAVNAAREHAHQCYGGVLGESSGYLFYAPEATVLRAS